MRILFKGIYENAFLGCVVAAPLITHKFFPETNEGISTAIVIIALFVGNLHIQARAVQKFDEERDRLWGLIKVEPEPTTGAFSHRLVSFFLPKSVVNRKLQECRDDDFRILKESIELNDLEEQRRSRWRLRLWPFWILILTAKDFIHDKVSKMRTK
jgi:hypothetical protein